MRPETNNEPEEVIFAMHLLIRYICHVSIVDNLLQEQLHHEYEEICLTLGLFYLTILYSMMYDPKTELTSVTFTVTVSPAFTPGFFEEQKFKCSPA